MGKKRQKFGKKCPFVQPFQSHSPTQKDLQTSVFYPQEERRHRSDYEKTEICEREKFALFSAAVRASHEKERTRAERTKNWSVIGSVLGALIGVMGSTYINHVRLQVSRTMTQTRSLRELEKKNI